MNKKAALKACQELLNDIDASDMNDGEYIEVLEELISDAEIRQTAKQAEMDGEEEDSQEDDDIDDDIEDDDDFEDED